jgi:hypothetical protein
MNCESVRLAEEVNKGEGGGKGGKRRREGDKTNLKLVLGLSIPSGLIEV